MAKSSSGGLVWAAMVLAGMVLLASCGRPPAAESAEGSGSTPAGMLFAPAAGKGRPAPDFALESIEGGWVKLADSAGKVRLIDFWATWCAPCREEIPMFKELYETYGPQGFTILAISDESSSAVREFVTSHDIDYPNLIDPGEVTAEYGVLALPSAYLLDQDGTIVETYIGPKPRKVLEQQIVELLGKRPAT